MPGQRDVPPLPHPCRLLPWCFPGLTKEMLLQQGDFQVTLDLVQTIELRAVEVLGARGHDEGPWASLEGKHGELRGPCRSSLGPYQADPRCPMPETAGPRSLLCHQNPWQENGRALLSDSQHPTQDLALGRPRGTRGTHAKR